MQEEWRPAGRVVRSQGVESPSGFPDRAFTVPANSKVSLLIDNSDLTTGYPELTVSGGKGSTTRLKYAEALVDNKGEKGNRNDTSGKHIEGVFDEFIADGSESRAFVPLGWKTWRYVQLEVETADQPLRIDRLRTLFTAFPFEERAHFQSDDDSLKPIWDIGWRTARLDAHDTYMDTPYWERMQYIGDTRIQALISYTVAGDDRLARQAIQAFNNSRFSEGITRSRHPSSVRQVIPTFSLLWVGMVHDFWMYRSDPDFVWVALPGVRMERWIIDNQARYRRGVFLAVGDALSLLSGRRSFAPPWMQRMGLTWAYRLCKEPLRLGPRYLRYNSMFVSNTLEDMEISIACPARPSN